MKKILLAVGGLGTLLSGCDYRAGGNWRENCEANYTYDSFEYSRCVDRVTTTTESGAGYQGTGYQSDASQVSIDPKNANRPGWEELGKGRIE